MAEREYIKLTVPRQRGGFAIVSSHRSNLWLGRDHLLCVETEGYTESYKRFYFRDIQSVTLRRTKRWAIWNWVLGVPTLIMIAGSIYHLAFGKRIDTSAAIVGVVLLLVFGVPLLINNWLGPTCACQLRTAVQIEDVPSMGRVRRARKVMNRLRPLIAEAQGQLTAEEIPLRLQELVIAPADGEPPIMGATEVPPQMTN